MLTHGDITGNMVYKLLPGLNKADHQVSASRFANDTCKPKRFDKNRQKRLHNNKIRSKNKKNQGSPIRAVSFHVAVHHTHIVRSLNRAFTLFS